MLVRVRIVDCVLSKIALPLHNAQIPRYVQSGDFLPLKWNDVIDMPPLTGGSGQRTSPRVLALDRRTLLL
jgi:hypothetical protein